MLRNWVKRQAAFAFFVAFCGSALAQTNVAPPQWLFGGPNISGRALSSCQEAWDQSLAIAERNAAPNTLTIVSGTTPCQQNVPQAGIRYRTSDMDPTTPDRQIGMQAYCGNLQPTSGPTPARGLFCFSSLVEISRTIGFCLDCLFGVGNPVSPGFGNKLEVERDYVGAGPFPLRFERVFNSAQGARTNQPRIGTNWTHTYFRRVVFSGPTPTNIVLATVDRPDGRAWNFNLSAGVWVADQDVPERLELLSTGWRYTTRDDEVELYDLQGRLQSIMNRAGLTQTVSYFVSGPFAGLMEKVTDPFGRTLTFEYGTTKNVITAVIDPAGGRFEYTYFTTGMEVLIGVKYPDNTTKTYHRENPNNGTLLTGITDENGIRYLGIDYVDVTSGASKPQVTRNADGIINANLTVLSYGSSAFNTSFTDVTQYVNFPTPVATRRYNYSNLLGIPQLTSITGPACPSCGPAAQTFNANGYVATRTDWNGNRTNFGYDLARNLETSRVEALTSGGATTAQSRTISTQWHPTLRIVTGIAEPLRRTTFTHDALGNVLTRTVQATTDTNGAAGFGATASGSPRIWTNTYNANGQVLTMDGPRTDVTDVTTYTYYPNNDADINKRGNVATVTNAAGHVTEITSYNAHGQPLTIVDANGLTTTLVYDARRRLTSRSVGGELTSYTYDNVGQLTKVTLPDNSFLSYTYDAARRLKQIQDNLGNKVVYTLDLAGNRTKDEVFDSGNVLAQTRSRVFSNLNRLFQELGATSQTTEYGYDNQGNVLTVKDPLNKTTTNQYDALNRVKQVTDPGTGVTLYGYNGLDALTSVSDPRTLVTGYTVNGLGDLTQQVSPDTGTTGSTYNAAGSLATQTDAKSQATTYAYDALERVTLITFNDGSKQAYAYDAGTNGVGRLTSITETNPSNAVTSTLAYTYTQHGRVASETRTVGGSSYVLGYAYDSFGRLSGLTYPSGRTLTYTYDALGRVSQISTTKDSQTQVVVQNVQYHPFGGAKSWTLGNGQIYSRSVDLDGRIASYTIGATTTAIGFDAASRITSIGANTYGYDTLDRLNSAILPSSNYGYSYDGVGNRLTKTTGANTDTYTYSPTSNRIATLTPSGSATKNFVFDANGSTTDDAQNTYAYDTRGRMVQATSTMGATTYQVNALGQRIRKTNSQGDTIFTYDTWGKLIAESDPAGAVKRELIYLGDVPVGVVQ